MAKSNAERQREYRERRKAEAIAHPGSSPTPQESQEEAPEGGTPEIVQTEAYEQMVRDSYGYSASEKRTQAERQAVADRITGRLSDPELREPG